VSPAPAIQQEQHTERKGDVGGDGNRPAAPILWMPRVDGHEDHRRDEYAAKSRNQRKRAARPGVKLPFYHLPLDLEPDQEKEKGHQPFIDLTQHLEPRDAGLQ
jgi:hypothetical protein